MLLGRADSRLRSSFWLPPILAWSGEVTKLILGEADGGVGFGHVVTHTAGEDILCGLRVLAGLAGWLTGSRLRLLLEIPSRLAGTILACEICVAGGRVSLTMKCTSVRSRRWLAGIACAEWQALRGANLRSIAQLLSSRRQLPYESDARDPNSQRWLGALEVSAEGVADRLVGEVALTL